jgi:hypothetical protein
MDLKEKILDILYKFRIDFSKEPSLYTEFGISEEDFEVLATTIVNTVNENESDNN